MQGKHWATLGMFLISVGLMVGGLDHWEDAVKPSFLAGVLTAIGTVLKAMYEDRPTNGSGGGAVSNGTRAAITGLVLAIAVSVSSCALAQKFTDSRHNVTVGVVTAHAVLSTLQDGEALLVCDRPGAPVPPSCVPLDKHQTISGHLATAFELEVKAARLVRDAGTATPADVPALVQQIGGLVDQIVKLIPNSPQKDRLVASAAAAGGSK